MYCLRNYLEELKKSMSMPGRRIFETKVSGKLIYSIATARVHSAQKINDNEGDGY
jgi:hypothetical protein